MTQTFSIAWYRWRATFARRWSGYLIVVVLIGLTGGLAMGSIAGARRTQSSFPTFLASTHPSTMSFSVFSTDNSPGPVLTSEIKKLPDVSSVDILTSGPGVPLTASGAPRLSTLNSSPMVAEVGTYLQHEDRLAVIKGRLANPHRPDQIVLTSASARLWGVHVGSKVPLGFYSPDQENLKGFGTPAVAPVLTVHATVVGIVETNSQVVQDDVDGTYGFVFLTPALTKILRPTAPGWRTPAYYALTLRNGNAGVASVERALVKLVPPHDSYEFHVTSSVTSTVELALKPESVALGAFGVIAALICLILSVQALTRLLRRDEEDRRIMRALGASRSELMSESLLGLWGSTVAGVALALVVALALSPLAPIGPVRAVYPSRGIAFDGTVLGLGSLALLAVLSVVAAAGAFASASRRSGVSALRTASTSGTVRRIRALGLPLTTALGAHFALESSRTRDQSPVRSTLLGAILAVTLLVTTVTFASGLHTLVSTPPLYGWNWNYALNPADDIPNITLPMLREDLDVAAWSGADYNDIAINGITLPMLMQSVGARVAPPILSGHTIENANEIVLGAQTMALLHTHIGGHVTVSYGSPASAPIYLAPRSLLVVGTATFPAIGYASTVADHTAMGTGALVPTEMLSPEFLALANGTEPHLSGPEIVFVRLRAGVSPAAGRANLVKLTRAVAKALRHDPLAAGDTVSVLSVQRPAQIVDYRTIGATPVVLASALAIGAVGAFFLTLSGSVRRRRRELAVYKTLGLSKRQLAAAISWQATIDALIGVVAGVPLGILFGRELWTLFARNINAVPRATVPTLTVVLIALGTIVIANLAAFRPGRRAATTSPGLVLRSE